MRQENYLIALFNKDLLDLRVPLPPALQRLLGQNVSGPGTDGARGMVLTRALEWNLRFCLMEFLFDARGRVRKVFLKARNRGALIEGCVLASLIVLYDTDFFDQAKETIHIHGNTECHFCPVHRIIPTHVLVLPLF
jgi:hypothetical protein